MVATKPPTRRQFLQTSAAVAAAALADFGCADPAQSQTDTDEDSLTKASDSNQIAEATAAAETSDVAAPAEIVAPPDSAALVADFADLAKLLKGKVLIPGEAGFAAASLTFHRRFDAVQPRAIAQCADATDVQAVVTWARKYAVPVRIRSGGHGYAGYAIDPKALTLDVRALNSVELDVTAKSIRVGAGAEIVDVQAKLWPIGLALATGSCPTVGVAGLALGGGYGLISRQYGLTCDALTSLDIVLANGAKITADASQNADLFWACRGAGGGQFGVVTSLTFAVAAAKEATTFYVQWPWASASNVLDAWQNWAPTAADGLTATCHIFGGGKAGAEPTISIGGAFLGNPPDLQPLLDQLQKSVGVKPSDQYQESGSYAKMAPQFVDCDGVVAHCQLVGTDPQAQVPRGNYLAKSDYFAQGLPKPAIALILQAMELRAKTTQVAGLLFDPYGGAVAKVALGGTAFFHRKMLFSCQYLSFSNSKGVLPQADTWLTELYDSLRIYVSGQTYQNYADADLANWQQEYYGSNYPKLQVIKQKYDPEGFFEFPQAIKP